MNTEVNNHPNLRWAERKDRLFVTIELLDVKDPVIDIVDERTLTFSGTSHNQKYSLNLELFDEVNKADSKWNLNARNIFLNIKKKNSGPYWNFLTRDKKKANNIKVDWNMYVDEDEEDERGNEGMGGFPGMGGMGGNNFDMGNLQNMMGGMGGMGGLGGMGGMQGMEGMEGMEGLDEDDVKEGEENAEGGDNKNLDDLDKPQEL